MHEEKYTEIHEFLKVISGKIQRENNTEINTEIKSYILFGN